MKRHSTIGSRKNYQPALADMPHGTDRIWMSGTTRLSDLPLPQRDPNPQKPRDPRPGNRKDPDPIRQPEIWPPEEWKFPRPAKKDEQNKHEKDNSRKPGFNHADWHGRKPHTLEEHLVCGYEKNGSKISQLILGDESENGAIRYTGHVPLDEYLLDALVIASQPKSGACPFSTIPFMSDNPAVWIERGLACLVECDEKTDTGLMMAPVYRGLKAEKPLLTAPAATARQ